MKQGTGEPLPSSSHSDISIIPVAKLANSAKVAQVIEKLKQNLSTVPPVIDSDCLSLQKPETATPIVVSRALPLKATSSNMESTLANEAAIVGPVASSIGTSPSKEPPFTIASQPVTTTQPSTATLSSAAPPTSTTTTSEAKISEISMRTRRKVNNYTTIYAVGM